MGFIATVDRHRAREFYEDTLALDVLEDTPFALVFDGGGTTVRVTPVTELTVQPFTVLGWMVDDITSEVSALTGKGVVFELFPGMEQDELGIWTTPGGAKVAWFKDPDGNLLSLTAEA